MSTLTSFNITVERESGTLVINMIPECLKKDTKDLNIDINIIDELLEKFQCFNVVVDLSNSSIVSSGFLGLLVRLQKHLQHLRKEKKGQLVLCCLTEHVKQVIRITHLDKIFSITDTQEEALASLE